MLNRVWLRLFQIELLLLGACLASGRFLLVVTLGLSRAERFAKFAPLLVAAGALVIVLAGLPFLPAVERRLRVSRTAAYVIRAELLLAAVLVGMELLLRLTVFNQPAVMVESGWFGTVPAPGSFYLWGREGLAVTHYDGLPGEIRTPYRGGRPVLLLGDSFLEGLQIGDDEKLASVAEAALRADGFDYDLRNLGTSGLSMADYVAFIPKYKELVHPAAIVLLLQEGDFIESLSSSQATHFTVEGGRITGIASENDLDGAFHPEAAAPIFRPMLFQYGRTRLTQLLESLSGGAASDDAGPELDLNLAGQQMDLLMKACGDTPLLIAIYPHAPRIAGDGLQMDDREYERLREFLRGYPAVPLVDPLPDLQSLARAGILPMGFFNSTTPGEGHLNPPGNAAYGRLLARRIEEALR